MNARELKEYYLKQDFEKMKVSFKEVAHQSFLRGWLKAWGHFIIPKKWLLKQAERDWRKIEYLFDLDTPVASNSDKETKREGLISSSQSN